MPIYPLSAVLTPHLPIPFTSKERTGSTNEDTKGANKSLRKPSSWFFIVCFNILVTSSINTLEWSNTCLMILWF